MGWGGDPYEYHCAGCAEMALAKNPNCYTAKVYLGILPRPKDAPSYFEVLDKSFEESSSGTPRVKDD